MDPNHSQGILYIIFTVMTVTPWLYGLHCDWIKEYVFFELYQA